MDILEKANAAEFESRDRGMFLEKGCSVLCKDQVRLVNFCQRSLYPLASSPASCPAVQYCLLSDPSSS